MSREPATLPSATDVAAAERLVEQLLEAKSAARRRALVERHTLAPDAVHAAVLRLIDIAAATNGNPPRMDEITAAAEALAERSGDPFLQAMALMRRGDVFLSQVRFAEARPYYDQAEAIFKRLDRPVEAARTRVPWIIATSGLGDPRAALRAGRAAERVLEAHGATERLATLHLHIGAIGWDHGRPRLALQRFTRALTLYRSVGESGRLGVGRCHLNRALILTRLGRPREALADYGEARAIFLELGSTGDLVKTTRGIGETQMGLGRYTAALRAFEETRTAFLTLGMTGYTPMMALDMADCYLRLNRPADALQILAAAQPRESPESDSPQFTVGIATRRASALIQLGQTAEATAVLDELERYPGEIETHQRAWLVAQLAAQVLRDGAWSDALHTARRAQALAHATGIRQLLADARTIEGAALLGLGRVEEAQRAATAARRSARSIDAAAALYRVHDLLGAIAEACGQVSAARRHYTAAVEQHEREQRGVIFEFRDGFATDRGRAYERLALLQLQAGQAAEAFATAERAKSRALHDAIAGVVELRPRGSAAVRRMTKELAAAREEYTRAARDDGTPQAELGALEGRITSLVQRLQIAGSAETVELLGAPAPALPLLSPRTALVEFFFCGDDMLRFWIDAGGVRGELLGGVAPRLRRLIELFRLGLDTAERAPLERRAALAAEARKLLQKLYETVFAGLPDLGAYDELVVVPHGLLHYLPFHALFDGERYLVEHVAVSYAPSAAIYDVCRSRRPRRGEALVLAHSAGGVVPFALEEAAAVAGLLGAEAHLESAASGALLRGSGKRAAIIHLAAHGRFRADAPLFSAIELGDGPLSTVDVFALELRSALVVLSACETGRAVLGGGDELVGMARAFLYAGAAGLLVSQWRVDDAATARLMSDFYRELARGAGRAVALRRAQRVCIESDDNHPFLWAGLQIIGDNQGIVRRPRAASRGGA